MCLKLTFFSFLELLNSYSFTLSYKHIVKVKLYKGALTILARSSLNALYSEDLVCSFFLEIRLMLNNLLSSNGLFEV
ncbi:hypothetical protein EQO05_12545 [Methanosarcina sp. MSH10X1]|nr:hypothetical protein EQO05_12545 [Methanosarcina sp. MSH10X1]